MAGVCPNKKGIILYISPRRWRAAATTAVAGAALGIAVAALPAQAVTPGCAANGFCGTQQHYGDGLVFDVFHQAATVNNKVISYSNSTTDKATDFINYHPTSGPGVNDTSVKAFKYAPGGVSSHLCLSDPGPGFGTVDLIVLRHCNGSGYQTWKPYLDPVTGFYSWRNLASHQFITSNGFRGQLTDVKDGNVGTPGNNQPTFDHSQLWQFTQS